MVRFRMICPDCSAVILTSSPEAMVWEHCPACGNHVWDACDLMMTEVETERFAENSSNMTDRFMSN